MAGPTVRATATLSSGGPTSSIIPKPTGAVTGDVIVAAVLTGASSLVTPSAPAGWTLVESVSSTAPDPYAVGLFIYWKAYDGASSWTWTHASASTQGFSVAIIGADTTTPLDVAASKAFQNDNPVSGVNTATAPSITTVTADTLLLSFRDSWDGNGVTPPSGWTEMLDIPVLWAAYKAQSAAGATGTVAVPAGNGSARSPWGIILMAIRPASTGGTGTLTTNTPTITVDVPTVAWSGTVTAPSFSGSITANTPTVTVAVPDSAWSGTVTPPLFAGTITADTPTLTVEVPTVTWVGTATPPLFTGSIAADTPTVSVEVPTVAWSGTATVPVFTGSITADLPAVTIDPPTTAWTGTVSAPGAFTGTLDTTTPTVDIGAPTVAWTGTTSIPMFTGTITADTPTVSVGAPTVTWTGTSTVPQFAGTLTADTPTVTVDVPTVAWAGTVTAPSGATLVASIPPVTIGTPTVAWVGTATPPTYTGTLTADTPAVLIGTPTVAWAGTVTGGTTLNITVTGTLGPTRWTATLTPPTRTGTIRRRWDTR